MNMEQRIQMRLDEETAAKLDALRRQADDLPGRSEMIRRLIHTAADQLADRLPTVRDLIDKPPRKRK